MDTRTVATGLARVGIILWVILGVALTLTTLWAVIVTSATVLFWDQWADLATIVRFDTGEARIADLWRLHNEHSIPFPRLLQLIDYFLFDYTNRFIFAVSLSLQFLAACLLICEAWLARDPPRWARWFLTGAMAAIVTSAVQIEHLTTPFSVNFALAFVGALIAIHCLANAIDQRESTPRMWTWLTIALVWALIAPFSVSNGLLVLPLLVLYAWLAPLPRRAQVVMTFAAAAVWVWRWSIGFRYVPSGDGIHVGLTLNALSLYLGSPFWMWPASARVLGTIGLALGLGVSLVGLIRLRRLTRLQYVYLFVVWFNLGSAGVISLGRAGFPTDWVLVSRYAMGALVYWACLVALLLDEALRHGQVRAWAAPAWALVVATVVAVQLSRAHLYSISSNIRDRGSRERGELAWIVGAWDIDVLEKIYWNPAHMFELRPYLRERRRNSFAADWPHLLGRPLPAPPSAGTQPVGEAVLEMRLDPAPAEYGLPPTLGWAGGISGTATLVRHDVVLIADAEGIVRGFGRVSPTAPHWLLGRSRPIGGAVLWLGYAQLVGQSPLRAYLFDLQDLTLSPLDGEYAFSAN